MQQEGMLHDSLRFIDYKRVNLSLLDCPTSAHVQIDSTRNPAPIEAMTVTVCSADTNLSNYDDSWLSIFPFTP